MASRSYVITLAPRDRAAVLANIRTLLDIHPSLAGADKIVIPYITECYTTELVAG